MGSRGHAVGLLTRVHRIIRRAAPSICADRPITCDSERVPSTSPSYVLGCLTRALNTIVTAGRSFHDRRVAVEAAAVDVKRVSATRNASRTNVCVWCHGQLFMLRAWADRVILLTTAAADLPPLLGNGIA